MQGKTIRFTVLGMALALMLVSGILALTPLSTEVRAADDCVLAAGMPATVGLVQDRRGNLYAADPATGDVYCMPPESAPLLLARVPGKPSSLAVNHMRTVFVGTKSGVVYGILPNGSVGVACRVNSPALGLTVDRDGGLMVATARGQVVRIPRKEIGLK